MYPGLNNGLTKFSFPSKTRRNNPCPLSEYARTLNSSIKAVDKKGPQNDKRKRTFACVTYRKVRETNVTLDFALRKLKEHNHYPELMNERIQAIEKELG